MENSLFINTFFFQFHLIYSLLSVGPLMKKKYIKLKSQCVLFPAKHNNQTIS